MSRALFSPNLRLAWAVGSVALLAAFVAGDWMARERGLGSFLAPTADDLWLAVGLGGLLGLVGCVWERFLLSCRRAQQLAFHSASLSERMRWRHQGPNLRQSGWFFCFYSGWCVWSQVFVLPPLLASNAVMCACNRRLVAGFRTELSSVSDAERVAAAGRRIQG